MKCKICGASLKDIKAVGAHYRKKHPSKMKARKPRRSKVWKPEGEHAGLNTYQMVYKMLEDHVSFYHGGK